MILFWNKIIIRHFHDHNATTNPPNTAGGNKMEGIPPNLRHRCLHSQERKSIPAVRGRKFAISYPSYFPSHGMLPDTGCSAEDAQHNVAFPRGSWVTESRSFTHDSLFVESCIEGLLVVV